MIEEYLKDDFNPLSLKFIELKDEREFCLKLARSFPFLDQTQKTGPKWLVKTDLQGEVIFYPGSFNPWHLGHRACLDLCSGKNIVIVPDFNPWKEGEERQRPWKHFKELHQKLLETDCSIYPAFLAKETGNPTVDWFPQIKISIKSLLLGEDSFLNFHKWKDVNELIKHIKVLYVVPRTCEERDVAKQLKRFKNLKIVFLDHHNFEDLSSTSLRKK